MWEELVGSDCLIYEPQWVEVAKGWGVGDSDHSTVEELSPLWTTWSLGVGHNLFKAASVTLMAGSAKRVWCLTLQGLLSPGSAYSQPNPRPSTPWLSLCGPVSSYLWQCNLQIWGGTILYLCTALHSGLLLNKCSEEEFPNWSQSS